MPETLPPEFTPFPKMPRLSRDAIITGLIVILVMLLAGCTTTTHPRGNSQIPGWAVDKLQYPHLYEDQSDQSYRR